MKKSDQPADKPADINFAGLTKTSTQAAIKSLLKAFPQLGDSFKSLLKECPPLKAKFAPVLGKFPELVD